MTGRKIYLQPRGMLIQAICDLAELQRGKYTFSDSPNGIIHFLVKMYYNRWEFKFTVKDIGQNRSGVELALEGQTKSVGGIINREFALLDSMLTIGAEIDLE
ncbi:MAG: hypothetical protein FWC27_09075 [Firmicutes bacterium]|nr:hypothetical protein [Bacillota bacterium]